MTKVNCKETDCKYNRKGVCLKEEIDLEYLFQGAGVGCDSFKRIHHLSDLINKKKEDIFMDKNVDLEIIKKKLEFCANDLGMRPRGRSGLEAVEHVVFTEIKLNKNDFIVRWINNSIVDPYCKWEVQVLHRKGVKDSNGEIQL